MRQLVPGLLASLTLLVSCGPIEEPASAPGSSSQQQPIVGGTTTEKYPAVVALAVRLQSGRYEQFCTGTLVGLKTVLTAAHCIKAMGNGDYYWVLFGSNASQPTQAIHVKSQTKNPGYDGNINDFGVIELEQQAAGVVPIEMNPTPLTNADIGKSVRHVGFGITQAQRTDSGIKREVSTPIRALVGAAYESGATGQQTCSGDSGGPGLMVTAGSPAERVIGVVSYGDQQCLSEGVDGRVDFGLAWVKSVMRAWEMPSCQEDNQCVPNCAVIDPDCACVADGACTASCTDPAKDPDCPPDCGQNGVCSTKSCPLPDPDCVADGAYCSSPNQCQGRLCATDPQQAPVTYCTRACAGDSPCDAGMQCQNGQCMLPQRPVRQPFETCTAADFCSGGTVCSGPTNGDFLRCLAPCAATACAAGSTCEAGVAGLKYCRPPSDQLSFKNVVLPQASTQGTAAGCNAAGLSLWAGLAAATALSKRRRRG